VNNFTLFLRKPHLIHEGFGIDRPGVVVVVILAFIINTSDAVILIVFVSIGGIGVVVVNTATAAVLEKVVIVVVVELIAVAIKAVAGAVGIAIAKDVEHGGNERWVGEHPADVEIGSRSDKLVEPLVYFEDLREGIVST
jgi:hypothetical protein